VYNDGENEADNRGEDGEGEHGGHYNTSHVKSCNTNSNIQVYKSQTPMTKPQQNPND